ncbi:MAG TPA: amidohydrolase family protein, partial [Aestuariivirgaceae bacterium]|nr:amidohydrolase family protein [Aestuariivirgaceae bacterium]
MSDDSTRSAEPFRFVDPHVHWWDRSNEWLVTATQEQADAFNMGDVSGMNRNYLRADYAADAIEAGVEVPKIVWVTATFTPGGATPEVEWVDKLTSGVPEIAAIIGSVEPGLSREDREQALAAQSKAAAFRGVRVLAGFDYESEDADEYMRMLADGGFVYDLVSHHETMAAAAKLAERHPDVPFILEHCGWPFDMQDPSYINAWKKGIDALASVESISCKISGLAMTCHAFNVDTQRPFV